MPQYAAMYIRVSTEDQTEYSPESQKRCILEYARAHDFEVRPDDIYADIGISGRKVRNRPAFGRMLLRAKEKPVPFSVILVWKFSRFARSRVDSIVTKQMLHKAGIQVISVTEPLLNEPTAVLMEAMLEAMDEYYSLNLGEEVRRGMREKFGRGGLVSIAAYGYEVREGKLWIQEEEAAWVRSMFTWRKQGMSYAAITRRLAEAGVRTKRGGEFHAREVSYILNNPVYFGYARFEGKLKKGDFQPIMSDNHEEMQKTLEK